MSLKLIAMVSRCIPARSAVKSSNQFKIMDTGLAEEVTTEFRLLSQVVRNVAGGAIKMDHFAHSLGTVSLNDSLLMESQRFVSSVGLTTKALGDVMPHTWNIDQSFVDRILPWVTKEWQTTGAIVKKTQMNKSTVRNYLEALSKLGKVERDKPSGKFDHKHCRWRLPCRTQ